MPTVVGIGEVLWDILPQGKRPGGAPANFVLHCSQLGGDAYLVSGLGNDKLGDDLKATLISSGLKPDFLTTSKDHATGTVSVALDQDQNPHYQIQENVAWDNIPWSPQLAGMAQKADAVCFGSLAQRSPLSRETIHRFLDRTGPDCLRVFDINLRRPYPDPAVLLASLQKATVMKLNTDELDYLGSLLELEGNTQQRLAEIIRRFKLSCIALTRGAQGSILATDDKCVDCPGLDIAVQDTVGAGDAFTAALVVGLLRKWPLDKINVSASRIAAYVCSQVGAMGKLSPNAVGDFGTGDVPVREYRPPKQGSIDCCEFEARS